MTPSKSPKPMILIMSGPPGSGKSTYTKQLRENGFKVHICSADMFFTNPLTEEYKFDPKKIGEAHRMCMGNFLRILQWWDKSDLDYIVVDNTNTQFWEITPYASVAAALGFDFKIVRFLRDPNLCAERNVHGVPKEKVLEMAERCARLSIPKHWNVEEVR